MVDNQVATPKVALITDAISLPEDYEMQGLCRELRKLGIDGVICDWEDNSIIWSCFDLVVMRSPWSYTNKLPIFLDWMDNLRSQVHILNNPDVIKWNLSKSYLQDLQKRGVPCIETIYVDSLQSLHNQAPKIHSFFEDYQEIVVKPSVGAYSRGVRKFTADEIAHFQAHLENSLTANMPLLIQPYLQRVNHEGELDIAVINGSISHYVIKDPLLRDSHLALEPTQERRRIGIAPLPSHAEHVVEKCLTAIKDIFPHQEQLLYSRIDLLPSCNKEYRLLELEVFEPSLSLNLTPSGLANFASAIADRSITASRHRENLPFSQQK
jgi:glutathione synthase/RimK-type ligase-like ATP-grasp enzyme